SQVFAVTTKPAENQLGTEPVPFRHPLTGIATEPGAEPGDPNAEAIAVGEEGQIARYLPGQGWKQYPVQKMVGFGAVGLRDVAWPEPDVAYAVGQSNAIRKWHREGDSWTSDIEAIGPGAANLESVAFSSVDPQRGYVVGNGQIFRLVKGFWRPSQI